MKIKKKFLDKKVEEELTETQEAILTIYNVLNNGQRKKILKSESVKKLFDKHNIDYEE